MMSPLPTTTADYWVLKYDRTSAIIEKMPEGAPEQNVLHHGIPLSGQFPAGGTVRFSDDFPTLRKVCDFMFSTLRVLIVSEKVKRVFEGGGVDNCEFIPLKILDHKGKVASKEHYLCNVLGSEDALDLERSTVVMDALVPTQVAFIRKLALNREGISPNARIFRIRQKMHEFLIHDSIREALHKAGVTGFKPFPADGWNGRDF